MLFLLILGFGAADAAAVEFDFNVPRQPVHSALMEFAEQAGLTLVFPDDMVRDKSANALTGKYRLQEGVDILLAGTGLTPMFSNATVLSISANGPLMNKGNAMQKDITKTKAPLFKRLSNAFAAVLLAASGATNQATAQSGEETAHNTGAKPVVEEVIVTALKRNQSLQDAPAAVTVFSPETIERQNIRRPADFIELTPNVVLSDSNHAGETLITVRGDAQTRNTEAPVAVVVDGVVLTGRNQFNGELFDIEQIEVLKGPQGYLYGRNAIAGAIVITTKEPTNEFEGGASGGYGEGDEARARVSLSGPVIKDKLYARFSGAFVDRDGHFRNITRQDFEDPFNEKVGRLRFLWTPSEPLSLDLRASFSRVTGSATQWSPQTLIGDLQTSPQTANTNINDVHEIPFVRNVEGRNKQTKESLSVKIDYEAVAGTITSVTTYDDVLDVFASDDFPYYATENSTQFNVVSHEAFSQELRFTSPTDNRLRYIVGAYFTNIDNEPNIHAALGNDPGGFVLDAFEPLLSGPNQTFSFISDNVQTDAWAAFGILSYDLNDDLELTLAGRFDREEKDTVDVSPPQFSTTSGLSRALRFEQFQPKINLTWRTNDQLMIYGGYAKGFQAGGFNGAQTFERTGGTVPNEYGDSTADNFEVGFKSTLLDGRMVLNGAAFFNTKKNAQQFQFIPAGTLNAVTVIDEIELFGAELEIGTSLTEGLELSAGLGWIDAEITKLDSDPVSLGNRAPFVAKVTANISLTHVWRLADAFGRPDAQLVSNLSWEHRGNQHFNSRNSAGSRRDALNLLDARIALETDGWSIALWGKNLTDELYPEDVVTVFTEAPLTTYVTYRAAPRTWGFEVSVNF